MSDSDLRRGTVAFLFTDIESSTQLLRSLGDDYAQLLVEHQRLLVDVFAATSGRVVDTQGDSLFVVFPRVRDAAAAAESAQRELAEHVWPRDARVRVRMGIHVGEPQVVGDRYVGLGVHRAARISAAAHGGQVLLSQIAASLLVDNEPASVSLRELGQYELKDFDGPERLSQLVVDGLPSDFPPLKAVPAGELPKPSKRRRVAAISGFVAATTVALVAVVLLQNGGDSAPTVLPDSLVKIDVATNQIVDVVSLGDTPSELEMVGDYVFVAGTNEGTLSRYDMRTRDLTTSGSYRARGALDRQGNTWLWAASGAAGQVWRIEPESLGSTTSVQLPYRANGGVPIAVGGGSLWESSNSSVRRWQLDTLRLQREYPTRFDDFPVGFAYGHGAAWLGLGAPSNALLRIDAASGRARRIPVGSFPTGPAVGFGSIWAAMLVDDTVWRVNPRTGKVRDIINVGDKPFGVAVGSGSVWVTNHCDGTISRIDPQKNTVIETVETGFHPLWLVVGGGFAWVGVSGEVVLFETCPTSSVG